MSRPTDRNWWIFALSAVVLVAAMVLLTAVMVRLDGENAAAREDADHQIAMSKALWRMDSWLAPQLAREAARPHFVYQAYYPQAQAYTKILSEIEAGEVLTPSPLLTFRSAIFPLHFQLDGARMTSPQVPQGNWRDLTEGQIGAPADLEAKTARLDRLRSWFRKGGLKLAARYAAAAAAAAANVSTIDDRAPPGRGRDYVSRARSMDQAKQSTAADPRAALAVGAGDAEIGPLLPIWIDREAAAAALLIFVRQVQRSDRVLFQGLVVDWPRLRATLLEQVDGLFDTTRTEVTLPAIDDLAATSRDHVLATVPARLQVAREKGVYGVSPRTVLVVGVTWGGLLISLLAVALALHSTNQYGQRRARFASAVTHELRTPLTTFRMYSEMLADDMVTDAVKRTEYLNTLKGEADRLSRLVENVLSYARIEDGRFNTHPERIRIGALLDRTRPVLLQRTRETDQDLEITVRDDVELLVDVEAVTQILFNLVDNACKYASGVADKRIEVAVDHVGEQARITVRDHGPGIPARLAGAIFRPFERAVRSAAENEIPGVGLGLALARALAVDLGGRLELGAIPATESGALFVLTIPTATPRKPHG